MAYKALLNRVHGGTALSSSGVTVFTFNTGLAAGGAILRSVTLVNTGTTKRACRVWLVPSGSGVATTNQIAYVDVPPKDTVIIRGPWYETSAGFVAADQDSGTDITARVTAQELT
jgi:hypothetical protein